MEIEEYKNYEIFEGLYSINQSIKKVKEMIENLTKRILMVAMVEFLFFLRYFL